MVKRKSCDSSIHSENLYSPSISSSEESHQMHDSTDTYQFFDSPPRQPKLKRLRYSEEVALSERSGSQISWRTVETLLRNCSCFTPWDGRVYQQSWDLLEYAKEHAASAVCMICYENDFTMHFETVQFLMAVDALSASMLAKKGVLLVGLSVDNPFVHRALIEQQERHCKEQNEYSRVAGLGQSTEFSYSMPLLSDLQHTLYKAFDSALEDPSSVFDAQKGTFRYLCINVSLSPLSNKTERFSRLDLVHYRTGDGRDVRLLAHDIMHALHEIN